MEIVRVFQPASAVARFEQTISSMLFEDCKNLLLLWPFKCSGLAKSKVY